LRLDAKGKKQEKDSGESDHNGREYPLFFTYLTA
jgi:hypothetical protein